MDANQNFYHQCEQQFDLGKRFLIAPQVGKAYSYGDLASASRRNANYLKGLGLVKGERVMVQVTKTPQNIFWYFACLRLGLIYLPLNTAYTAEEVSYFVDNAKPSLVICDPELQSNFTTANCPIRTLDKSGNFSDPIGECEQLDTVHCSADDIAVILYTSGTTGKPKGAMISHGNLYTNATALIDAWEFSHNDVLLHALPIFHIHGLFVATHLPVLSGAAIIFLPAFDPALVNAHLPAATVYMGVPTNYVRLLATEDFNHKTCQSMRLFTSGSAPLLPQTFAAMAEQTGHSIVERYGMTETGMNTSNPVHGERKAGTVGPPLAGVSVKIVDDQGLPVHTDEPGNLLVKGDNVFKGYWQMPEKTQQEFTADGFFKTGDIASIDADGYVSIIGRDKDMIISGGLNVYPKEIENVIDRLDSVIESAVIGIPDADFGEAVVAVIVARDSESKDGAYIRDQLKEVLANFKVPKNVFFVDQLPRNTMGKVQKNILRQNYAS